MGGWNNMGGGVGIIWGVRKIEAMHNSMATSTLSFR